jgi:hypothetical protein
MKNLINLLVVLSFLLYSCNKSEIELDNKAQIDYVNESYLSLYNPTFPSDIITKKSKQNLKIDFRSSKQKVVNNEKFTQYNILNSGSYSIAKTSFGGDEKVVSICKQFYVIKEYLNDKKSFSYLVTMVSFDSYEIKSKYNFSYLNNEEFNGLMIFSRTDGDIIGTIYYDGEKRHWVEFVNSDKAVTGKIIKLLLYERITSKSFTYDPNTTYICADCGAELLEDDFWDFTCQSCGMILGVLDPAYCSVIASDPGGEWIIYPYNPVPSPPDPGDGDEGGSGGGGGGDGDVPPPTEEVHLTLSASTSFLPLLYSYTLTLSTVPSGMQLSDVNFYIYGNANQTLFKLNEESTMSFTGVARTPGCWNIKAVALSGQDTIVSNTISIEMGFPSTLDILNDPNIQSEMHDTWVSTKEFASTNGRKEQGFWVYVNSTEGAFQRYFKGDVFDGPVITGSVGTNGTINFSPPTLQEYGLTPLSGGKYVVAMFHTHTPITYIIEDAAREVGPSSSDFFTSEQHLIPGLVYDYIGGFLPYRGFIGIVSGHEIDDPSQIYTFGLTRRPTLPN